MTSEERLKRIRSLEKKVALLENQKYSAERESEGTTQWALKAFEENRRLGDMITRHWDEKNDYMRLAGLDPVAKYKLIARFNKETRQWERMDGQGVLFGDF